MFSGAVKIGDLNDFIAPSQACVVSLDGGKLAPSEPEVRPPPPHRLPPVGSLPAAHLPAVPPALEGGWMLAVAWPGRRRSLWVCGSRWQACWRRAVGRCSPLASHPTSLPLPLRQLGEVALQPRAPPAPAPGGFQQTLAPAPGGPVQVTLHDCLACSGCVTSAETVLLQHQSAGELAARLADPGWTVVVSLSPQSVAALAALHGLAPGEAAARVAGFLRRLGARAVFDIAEARQLALAEAAAEFAQRYRASRRGAAALAAAGAAAGAAAAGAAAADDGGEAMDVDHGGAAEACSGGGADGDTCGGPLPMLASACPGWVCYAEKTHGEHVLPHIATGAQLAAGLQLPASCPHAPLPLPSVSQPARSTADTRPLPRAQARARRRRRARW